MGARSAYAVTPHDTNALSPVPDSLVIGGGGTVTFRARRGTTDVTLTVPDGFYLLVEAQYVRATGTTATEILALIDQ